jgi:hypothetical protein
MKKAILTRILTNTYHILTSMVSTESTLVSTNIKKAILTETLTNTY